MATEMCEFCWREAIGFTDPLLCGKHLVIVRAVERMKDWGWVEIDEDRVRAYLWWNRPSDFDMKEIPALCATMPEFGRGDEKLAT